MTEKWEPTQVFETEDGGEVIHDHKNTFVSAPNPKKAIGTKKAPISYVPAPVLMEVGIAMMEGGIKYGPHNFRETKIDASDYYNAAIRHLMQWWEGEDIDPDSGLSHITKAIASLVVLRDSMLFGSYNDDRPPPYDPSWITKLNEMTEKMREKTCDINQNHTPSRQSGLDIKV